MPAIIIRPTQRLISYWSNYFFCFMVTTFENKKSGNFNNNYCKQDLALLFTPNDLPTQENGKMIRIVQKI